MTPNEEKAEENTIGEAILWGCVHLPESTVQDNALRIPFLERLPLLNSSSGPVYSSRQMRLIGLVWLICQLLFLLLHAFLPVFIFGDWFWTLVGPLLLTVPLWSMVRASGVERAVSMIGAAGTRSRIVMTAALPEKIGPWRPRRVQLVNMVSCYPSPMGGKAGQLRVAPAYRTHGFRPMGKFPVDHDVQNNLAFVEPLELFLERRDSRNPEHAAEFVPSRKDHGLPVLREHEYSMDETLRRRREQIDASAQEMGAHDAELRPLTNLYDDDETSRKDS